MTYQVLALKWRPTGFAEVVAQDHVTQTLINSISNDRIANAYLFTGPRGVGKTTSARILAKALNCKNGPTPEPCDKCSNCKEIAAGRNLDVFEIDGASNRGIDEMRNLKENVRYAPSSSKFKIYIIDEVHMLTTEAFNALLKTLEEPPEHVRFIFATTEPHKIPATILSRCQLFDFKRIPLDEIITQLKTICKHEEIEIDEESLFLIAKKADGSLRDGESLLDQMISFCGKIIKIDDVVDAFRVVSQDLLFESTSIILKSDIQEGLHYIERLINSGYDVVEFLQSLIEHLRNLLYANAVQDNRLLETSDNYKEQYTQQSKDFSSDDLLRMIQVVSDTEFEIKRSPNPRVRLEMCMIKLIKMDNSVTINEVIERLSNPGTSMLPEKNSNQTTTSSENQTSPPIQTDSSPQKKNLTYPPPIDLKQNVRVEEKTETVVQDEQKDDHGTISVFKGILQLLVQCVEKRRLFVSVFLKEGEPSHFQNNKLEIGFSYENGFQIEAMRRNKEIILQAIQEIMGITVVVKFSKVKLQNDKKEEFQEEESISKPKKIKKIDPMVKKIIELFDGELITSGG